MSQFTLPRGIYFGKGSLSKLKTIAANAVSDACTVSNPRAIDDEKMEKLLACVYWRFFTAHW